MFNVQLLSFLLVMLLSGCSATTLEHSGNNSGNTVTDRQLIRTADLEVEVESALDAATQLEILIKTTGGYVDNMVDRNQKRIVFKAKIPSTKLDGFMQDVSKLGELTSKQLRVKDVTEKLVDVNARILNLQSLIERLRTLLNRAETVADIIKIEAELNRVQSDLDVLTATKNSLTKRVAMSDVDITIKQKRVYGPLGYLAIGLYWVVEKLFIIK